MDRQHVPYEQDKFIISAANSVVFEYALKNLNFIVWPTVFFFHLKFLGLNYWSNCGKPELKKRSYVRHYENLKRSFISRMEGLFSTKTDAGQQPHFVAKYFFFNFLYECCQMESDCVFLIVEEACYCVLFPLLQSVKHNNENGRRAFFFPFKKKAF